jgi:hypothetical protein
MALEKAGLVASLGEENIAENIDVALKRAEEIVRQSGLTH